MALYTRWILLSLLAVWRCQADAFTFGTDYTDGDEGVDVESYFPAPRSFVSETGQSESDSSVHGNQLQDVPLDVMPRAKKPISPSKPPFCITTTMKPSDQATTTEKPDGSSTTQKPDGDCTTTRKPLCPPDRPRCKPRYYRPYWIPHHHFVYILNHEEPDWPQLPGQDDPDVQYGYHHKRPQWHTGPHPRPQWFHRPQGAE